MKQIAETGHGPLEQPPQWDVRSNGRIEGAEPLERLMRVLELARDGWCKPVQFCG